jgi:hypothetical protein
MAHPKTLISSIEIMHPKLAQAKDNTDLAFITATALTPYAICNAGMPIKDMPATMQMVYMMNKIDPGIIREYAKLDMQAIVIFLAEKLFEKDELLNILEGRRVLRDL